MYKVQFINSYGKLHEYNFIRVAVPNEEITVYSDTGYAKFATEEVEKYYHEHDVKLVKANNYSCIQFRPLRIFLNVISGIRIIISSRKEKYDYCFVHYLSTRRAILSWFVPTSTKLVLITYGSDILRRTNFNNFFFKKMLDRAYIIDFTSGNLKYSFEKVYGEKYKNKTIEIPFPCYSYGTLKEMMKSYSKESVKKKFNIPIEKKIAICGHTSTENEQFENMIAALERIDDKAKEDFHFVFFMTYGSGNYKSYRTKIEDILSKSQLSYTVLNTFLPSEEVAMVHIMSDVHITSIRTDAISFFMLEEMYAGATLLYGAWLHYVEFEKEDFGTMTYKNFNDLTSQFNRIAKGDIPPKPANYREKIELLSSNEEIAKKWRYIFNMEKKNPCDN